jgi:hypothetical protein
MFVRMFHSLHFFKLKVISSTFQVQFEQYPRHMIDDEIRVLADGKIRIPIFDKIRNLGIGLIRGNDNLHADPPQLANHLPDHPANLHPPPG